MCERKIASYTSGGARQGSLLWLEYIRARGREGPLLRTLTIKPEVYEGNGSASNKIKKNRGRKKENKKDGVEGREELVLLRTTVSISTLCSTCLSTVCYLFPLLLLFFFTLFFSLPLLCRNLHCWENPLKSTNIFFIIFLWTFKRIWESLIKGEYKKILWTLLFSFIRKKNF